MTKYSNPRIRFQSPKRYRQFQPALCRLEDRTLLSGSRSEPPPELTEGNAAQWGTFASDAAATSVVDDSNYVKVGAQGIRFDTASGFDTGVLYPATPTEHWDLSTKTHLRFWAFALNGNGGGFQGDQPVVVLNSPAGDFTFTPLGLPMVIGGWQYYSIPLTGSSDWIRTTNGSPTLTDVTQLEIHQDTWGNGFTIWYDGMKFVTVTCEPPPVGDLMEGNANSYSTFASDAAATSVIDDATHVRSGNQNLKFDTLSGFDTGISLPSGEVTNWDLTGVTHIRFWAYTVNSNPFQGDQPVIVLQSEDGEFRYTPVGMAMPIQQWRLYTIPLAGSSRWDRTTTGTPMLDCISQLEIHHDTWDYGFTIYYDGLEFVSLPGSPPPGPPPPPGVNPDAIQPKVLLYVFDPIMENFGGVRQHTAYGWADPVTLTDQIVSDFATNSHGLVQWNVVDTQIVDMHPYFQDGFQHTDESFAQAWTDHEFHNSTFDYVRFINENNLAARVEGGEIDEVWIYAGPIGGMWESAMAGRGGYWINGPTYEVDCDKAFVVMGWNFERGVGEAIHSFGHRTESIMVHSYGTWEPNQNNNWSKFALLNKDAPGLGGVGNVHYPVNATGDYDYANTNVVVSNADDWYNYPNFTGTTRSFNYTEWSPAGFDPQREYLNWWYDHMPHFAGKGLDDFLNNWWRYIVDVDQFKSWNGNLAGTTGIPVVSTIAPEDGSTVSGIVDILAVAAADGALGRVDLYINDVYIATDTIAPFTFEWDTTGLNGLFTIVTKAYELQNGTEAVATPVTLTVGNLPPTDITLSNNAVAENQLAGALIGLLSTIDPNIGDTFTYLLVAGAGGDDNASFTISGNQLLTNAIFDFETKSSYTIRIRSTDNLGNFIEEPFTISINDANDAPVLAFINDQNIAEGDLLSLTVTANDQDSAQTLTFSLVSPPVGASIDPASGLLSFVPRGDAATQMITVRVTDDETPSASDQKSFTVIVSNVAPTATFSRTGSSSEGGSVTFSFSNQADPGADDVAAGFLYSYDFNNDGDFIDPGEFANITAVQKVVSFDDQGTYTVRGRIADKDGAFADYTNTFTIGNDPPSATFGSNSPGIEGQPVTISFSNVLDPSAADTAAGFLYSFDLNNDGDFADAGEVLDGAAASLVHVFPSQGSFVVHGQIEDKDGGVNDYTTTIIITNVEIIVTGFDKGGEPRVRVLDAETLVEKANFLAYDSSFRGGVRVASADVTGDGVPDIITAPGIGNKTIPDTFNVKVFDGVSFQPLSGTFAGFRPFGDTFRKGYHIVSGDVNKDGKAEIIVAPGTGAMPMVRVYSGDGGGFLYEIAAYPFTAIYKKGVRVASGDVNGDGAADVITQSGNGKNSLIHVFDGLTGIQLPGVIGSFNPFGTLPAVRSAAFIATGDVTGDGKADIIAAVAKGAPTLRVFDGATGLQINETTTADLPWYKGGIRVGVTDADGDGDGDILISTGKAPQQVPHCRVLDGQSLDELDALFADPASLFRGGAFVAGGR